MRRYVHIGTGNYHPRTARLYTDLGLFTCRRDIAADVSDLFNYLTGFGRARAYRKLLVAPHRPARRHHRADRARDRAPRGRRARPDRAEDERARRPALIESLYQASQAGVQVDLVVRGICCLRPGVPGRLGEHPRRRPSSGASSSTRAPSRSRGRRRRRTDRLGRHDAAQPRLARRARRPGRGPAPAREIVDLVDLNLSDNANAWELAADGTWTRRSPRRAADPRRRRTLMARYHSRAADGSGG